MTDDLDKPESVTSTESEAKPSGMSRRDLLKKGASAMPAVLTLPSGAALAASSAYIGSTTREGSHYLGNVLCLDTRNAEALSNGTTYKFVNTSYADVYVIPDGDYYPSKGRSGTPVKADVFCETGGTKFLAADSWPEMALPENAGTLVSFAAINSITSALDVDLKYLP